MIKGYLTCCGGERLALPDLLSWRLEYASGVPCDSFFLSCLWDVEEAGILTDAVGFTAEQDGETVFRGVVDECECGWDQQGARLEVSGRGMAALLLDNEALGCDYQVATFEDIVRDHVAPYGITTGETARLPAVPGFSVAAGSSEWQVLYEFTRYYGGVTPRFDREGRLVTVPWPETACRVVGEDTAVTELLWRCRRYGVLSEILVRDRTTQAVQRVVSQPFSAKGGRCRRVLTMPGRSSYQAMRYSGAYQLARSAEEWIQAEVRLPGLFCAWPGELVELRTAKKLARGVWRVVEMGTGVDRTGEYTRLVLNQREIT